MAFEIKWAYDNPILTIKDFVTFEEINQAYNILIENSQLVACMYLVFSI